MTTWDDFVREYGKQVGGVARLMLRRWKAPVAVDAADLEQEVWLAAWEAWQAWEPDRGGMTRAAYAHCTGRLEAQRWLHEQRNALRRSGKAPGRFPLAEALFLAPDVGDEERANASPLRARAIEPGQDAAVAFSQKVRDALRACETRHERHALEALVAARFDVRVATRRTGLPSEVQRAWRKVATA